MLLTIIIILSGLFTVAPDNFPVVKLQNGDLLFQEACNDNIDHAIKEVTESTGSYNFTHVGIVWINHTDTVVIEAAPPVVAITPLASYLKPEGKCISATVAGRLKEPYRHLIPGAIEEALKLIGKEYDYVFIDGNDKYYCSELIYEIFTKANNGTPIFELKPMTFKSGINGEFLPEWIEYYRELNEKIPEGEPGTNPGSLSKSDIVEISGIYK